jgi:hypothetical protein
MRLTQTLEPLSVPSYTSPELSRSDRLTTDRQILRRKYIRKWQYRPVAAYVPEFTQALLESGTGRVEIIESLRWLERGVVEEARHDNVPCPNSRQAPPDHRLECLAPIAYIPPHKVRC